MLLEQQQMIESLKTQLHRLLKHRFGPRSEVLDVDQLGLFADDSIVVELPVEEPSEQSPPASSAPPAIQRKKAVRVLKDLPREIRVLDLAESDKLCDCCGQPLHHFADECS